MELQDQPAAPNQPLILSASVSALEPKEALIPTTARLDIADAKKGLRAHVLDSAGMKKLARIFR
jgi:hypothetical protein